MSLRRFARGLPVIVLAALAMGVGAPAARAQVWRRVTLGIQFVGMRGRQPLPPVAVFFPPPFNVYAFRTSEGFYSGFGARITVRLVGRLGLDAEWDRFPSQGPADAKVRLGEDWVGPRFRVLGGPRGWALFADARLGRLWMHLPSYPYGPVAYGPGLSVPSPPQNFLAWNVGGTLERHLVGGFLWRASAEDVVLGAGGTFTNGPPLPGRNLQVSTGVAYRFRFGIGGWKP